LWLKECFHNHPNLPEDSRLCQDLSTQLPSGAQEQVDHKTAEPAIDEHLSQLPTRVLDIQCPDGSPQLRLYEPATGARGQYITLSHCWGKSELLTTKKETLEARKEQISEAELPKTFRDAVAIARRIGIRYLWIDSLCIIQDSKEDWQHEAALMGQYYTKSFLTISAAGSRDGDQGCLLPRRQYTNPVRLNLKEARPNIRSSRGCLPCFPAQTITETIQAPLVGGNDVYMAYSDPKVPFIHPEPADSRAWILQETALSPRVLLYGETMLAWLCNTRHCTERGDNVLHDTTNHYVMAPRLPHHLRHAVDYEVTDIAWQMASRWIMMESSTWWAKIVQNYSTRTLSFGDDKLPAISGCARAIQALNKDVYYAGLWKKTLMNDLLWQSVEGTKATRPEKYRAPSWSWAAIDGEVKCCITGKYDTISKKLIQLVSFEEEYLSEDTYGQIKSMTLHINGCPVRVQLKDEYPNEGTEWAANNRILPLAAIGPPCSCPECADSKQKLESLAGNIARKANQGEVSSHATTVGLNDTDVSYEGVIGMRHGFLEGVETGNAGPQHTDGRFSPTELDRIIGERVFEQFGTNNVGSCIFDIDDEVGKTGESELWCLPVNPQFGLLLRRDGLITTEDQEVGSYRRLGIVKLNLSWMVHHELQALALL
jgi:hypothetical protein